MKFNPFPNFNGCTVGVYEWISHFIPLFIMDVFTYPCWDWSWTMLIKMVQDINTGLYHKYQPTHAARSRFMENGVYKIGSEKTNYVIARSIGPVVSCCERLLLWKSMPLVPIITCNPNISLHASSWNMNIVCRVHNRSYRTFCIFIELNTPYV